MDEKALQDLQSVHTDGSGLTNIALPGIIKRIDLLYEGQGTFEINSKPGSGTKVTVVLPIHFS